MGKRSIVLVLLLFCSFMSTFSFLEKVEATTGTFGYTTIGTGLMDYTITNGIAGSKFYLDKTVNATSITAYYFTDESSAVAKCAIYNATDGSLVAETENKTGVTGQAWRTFNFTSGVILTHHIYYILALWTNASESHAMIQADDGDTDQCYWKDIAYTGSFPNPLNEDETEDYKHSIYCTFEELGNYNYFFYGLYDENSGLLEDAGSRAVNVTAYWSDGTAPETFEVNGTDYQYFDSSPEYFHFELGSVDREYWLSATEGDENAAEIYIFNASLTSYTLTFRDWTGALATYRWVSALRSINGTDMVVDKRKVDEQSKVVMGLEAYKKYVIVAEATAGTTYTWGDLTMTTDTSVTLIVKGTEFPQDVILTYRYVRAWANRTYNNATHDSIYVLYEDTQEATTSVNITIYYGNDTTAHTYEYNSTDSFSYDWDGAENETSYYAIVTVTHATYGTMIFRQSFLGRFADSPFNLDFLGALPGNIPMSTILPALILLIATLGFSALTAGIGGIVVVGIAALMSIMGWWTIDANLLVFAGILAIIYAVLKNYNRVTVR